MINVTRADLAQLRFDDIAHIVEQVQAQRNDLLAALEAALGPETSADCAANHHGFCQAHRLEPLDLCWVKVIERAIAKAKAHD
jgi:hypothetical protein